MSFLLTPAVTARAQQQTAFNFGPPQFFANQNVQTVGDAFANGNSIEIAQHAASNNRSLGALYFPTAADLSAGFETSFQVNSNNVKHLAFVLRGTNEKRTLITSTGVNNFGYNGLTNSVAVEFEFSPVSSNPLPQKVYVDAPDNINHVLNGHLGGFTLGSGTIAPGAFINGQHNIVIRYSPRSKVLEVFAEQQLALRVNDFNFADYGPENSVFVGLIAANTPNFTESLGPMFISSWAFGNNLNLAGIGPGYYSEPMTFKTTGQSFWNNRSDSVQWNSGNRFFGSISQPVNASSSSHGFSGGFTGQFNDTAGLRFLATANGGKMDVCYPLLLNILFPPQQTVAPGQTFSLVTNFTPDPGASLNTSSPSARFQAFLTLDTLNKAAISVGFPVPFDFLNINQTLFDFSTKVKDREFFDTDFILQHAADFGFIKNQTENVLSLKGDQGAGGNHTKTSGGSDTGTTKGAGKDAVPLDFLTLNLFVPNLGANGFLSLDPNSPTLVTGVGKSDIIGVHSDFTTALLDLAGLGELSPLINTDVSYSFSSVPATSFGWHIADLYGDLNLGAQLDHRFQPHPHLNLHFTDPNGAAVPGLSDLNIDLDQNEKPGTSPAITMPNTALLITPTVDFDNTLNTDATLTVHGDLAFNAFQLYCKISGLIDINAQVGPPPFDATAPIATISLPGFRLGGFPKIVGKPFLLVPKGRTNPLILTPQIQESRQTSPFGNLDLTLQTANIDPDAGVVIDQGASGEVTATTIVNSTNSVEFLYPRSDALKRGTHSLTIVNGLNSPFAKTLLSSNSITITITELKPNLNMVTPKQVVLTTPPTDLNGQPLLLNGPSNANGSPTEQFMNLTVAGNSFASDAVVRWNGQPLPTHFVTDTQLTAHVPGAYLKSVTRSVVTVFNGGPGGGESEPLFVTSGNPTPTLRQLGPSTSFAGAKGMTTMLFGTNFTPITKALWNGSPRRTTFISSKQLEMEIQDQDLVKPGQAQLSVDNGEDNLAINRGHELLSRSLAFFIGSTPVRTVLQGKPTITRADNGDYMLSLTIKNIGASDATGLVVSNLFTTDTLNRRVAAQSTPGLPALLGTLAPGASVTLPGTIRLPASVGTSGSVRPLTVLGSFSNGSFTTTLRVTLPGK